ncbi:MAG: branched-chain amino acid ABC transporter permease [candidate division WOR-3 bacterium]
MIQVLLQALINGLLLGGIYALLSLGLNLIFGVLKTINLAHGAFLMVGMYLCYFLWELFSVDPLMSLPIVVIALFSLGVLIERFIVRPALKISPGQLLVIIVGLSMVIEYTFLVLFSPNYRYVRIPSMVYEIFSLRIPAIRVVALSVSIIASVIFYYIISKTQIGRIIRAVALDRVRAALLGINTDRAYGISYAMGVALCGVTACLLTPIYHIYPLVGGYFIPPAFVVCIFGGLGNFTGGLIAAFMVGVIESIIGLLYNVELARAVTFAIVMALLYFRPTGLMGE